MCRIGAFLFFLVIIIGPSTAIAQFRPHKCDQIDLRLQARCQVSNAIALKDNALLKRLLQTNIYIDINDPLGCYDKNSYAICAIMIAKDLASLNILFDHGMSPNLAGPSTNSRANFSEALDSVAPLTDAFALSVLRIYFERFVDLDSRSGTPGAVPWQGTISRHLLGKCVQNPKSYPRFNKAVDLLLEFKTRGRLNGGRNLSSEIQEIIDGYTRYRYNVVNCRYVQDRIRQAGP